MKIPLKRFHDPSKSLVLEEEIEPSALDLDIGIMKFSAPVKVHAEAWKTDDDLTVQVHVEGERTFTCSNCLDEFNNLFEKDLTLHYDIKGLETVDVDPEVRDEIILEHPIRILCREDCRGLCQGCGANLNREVCRCKKKNL